MNHRNRIMLLLLILTASFMIAAAPIPRGYAYKQSIDVTLLNGQKVTVQFADDFPDSALQANIAYMQQDIPKNRRALLHARPRLR